MRRITKILTASILAVSLFSGSVLSAFPAVAGNNIVLQYPYQRLYVRKNIKIKRTAGFRIKMQI